MSKTIELDDSKLPPAMIAFKTREDVANIIYDWLHENQITHRRDFDSIPEDQKEQYRCVAKAVIARITND